MKARYTDFLGQFFMEGWIAERQGSVGETNANLVGDFERMFDAGADGRSMEVVPGEIQAGEAGTQRFDCREAGGVAQIVLWNGARPDGDIAEDGLPAEPEQGDEFPMNLRGQCFGSFTEGTGIGCASDEAGEQGMSCGSTAGEEGRVPHGAEDAETGGAGNEEAEAG